VSPKWIIFYGIDFFEERCLGRGLTFLSTDLRKIAVDTPNIYIERIGGVHNQSPGWLKSSYHFRTKRRMDFHSDWAMEVPRATRGEPIVEGSGVHPVATRTDINPAPGS
jgi:hypothetical protein